MLAKFEANRVVQNVQIVSFLTKTEFFKTIFDNVDAILQDVSVAEQLA